MPTSNAFTTLIHNLRSNCSRNKSTRSFFLAGAAGLDSSMFAHLKRNWSWNAHNSNSKQALDRTKIGRGIKKEADCDSPASSAKAKKAKAKISFEVSLKIAAFRL